MAALSLAPWQWGVIAAVYVLLFLAPSVWMWRKARADNDAPLTWASLVAFTSFLGIIEYRKHRSILRKRALRAERAKMRAADSLAHEAGPER
jgi:hypothetical protein